MMPNVTRGDRMAGLMTYLTGPGRANEHTEPHLVAGDDALMMWHDDDELGRDAALSIARHLDRPRVGYGVEVKGGHVWHCSLSLRADEGALTDEKWGQIANDFIKAMEFDSNEGTKAACRWVAVRHGASGNGNDHIHIAVNLVREDGTRASTHHDYRRAQVAARALEVTHDLAPLESDRVERSTRGWNPAEREAQATARARAKHERTRTATGAATVPWDQLAREERKTRIASELSADQPRYVLGVKVRGCATASRTEAEFVRRMRRDGLLVRARFADGRSDVVTGYSVAERPQAAERPIWYGGGHLARDLALPRLRDGWEDTPTGASEAAAEWNAARRGRRVVAPGREVREFSSDDALRQSQRLAQTVDRLASVPLDDRDTWATVARQTAGALAAWSNATEDRPGELAAAAEALSRSGQTFRRTATPEKAKTIAISGTALMLASAMRGGQGTVGQAALVREMVTLVDVIGRVAQAQRDERHAREALSAVKARLVSIHDRLPAPPARPTATTVEAPAQAAVMPQRAPVDPAVQAVLDRLAAGQAYSANRAISPVPTDVTPGRRRATATPGAGREGAER